MSVGRSSGILPGMDSVMALAHKRTGHTGHGLCQVNVLCLFQAHQSVTSLLSDNEIGDPVQKEGRASTSRATAE